MTEILIERFWADNIGDGIRHESKVADFIHIIGTKSVKEWLDGLNKLHPTDAPHYGLYEEDLNPEFYEQKSIEFGGENVTN